MPKNFKMLLNTFPFFFEKPLSLKLAKLFYKTTNNPQNTPDFIISTGGNTAGLNAWLRKIYHCKNILNGKLRGLNENHFTAVTTVIDLGYSNQIILDVAPSIITALLLQEKSRLFCKQHAIPEHNEYYTLLIGGNGAFTRQNKTIQTTPFSDGQIQLILDLIDKHQLNYMIDSDWNYSYSGDTTHPLYLGIDPNQTAQNVAISELEMIVKTVLFTTNEEIIKELKQADISVHFHGSEQLIDLSPTGISKWSAFDSLQLPTDFIMFGNDTNDFAMFDKATHSFVVGDLVTDVQNATYITQDTVSEAILSLAK